MILIVDSGSSKTHWKLVHSNGSFTDFSSQGLNPYFTDASTFQNVLTDSFPCEVIPSSVEEVFFYGSGCAAQGMAQEVHRRLFAFFVSAKIEVHSDVLAAARSLFGNSSGLVVILGSGTNVGFYDGKIVTHKTPSLGFAIGDEGSGAYLGKKLLKHWQYGELPKELADELEKKYNYSLSEILIKLYSEPFPNRFLAEFVPFLAEHSDHFFVQNIIEQAFLKLIERHLLKYTMFTTAPIGVVGSVGVVFKNQLKALIESRGGNLMKTMAYPLDGLTKFHFKND